MRNTSWYSRLLNQQPSFAMFLGMIVALLLAVTCIAVAQNPAMPTQPSMESQISAPEGYTGHHSVDMGGRMSGVSGSGAMYDSLVNMHTGPRVLGETFEMHALPGNKKPLVDDLKAFGTGFGGDPMNFAKLDFSKAKVYEFSGLFRRDRQYFDYDLLGNPNITTGLSINNMVSGTAQAALPWPQVMQSPVMFNTVRRMTDANLTLLPLSTWTFRIAYSKNTFEGPSLSPAYTIAKYDALLEQYQRNSTDDFIGAIEWKPIQGTKITYEQQVTHYKGDSFFTLAPGSFTAQEADGTPVYLGNWDSQTAYGIGACNTNSMGSGYTNSSNYTILSTPTGGGLPVINSACSVVTSYLRTQPTRVTTPTGTLRLQSSSIKNLTMNGEVHYTRASMNLFPYYENAQGLDGVIRSITYSGGNANAKRAVFTADYGFLWQVSPKFSLADQVNYSTVHEPGSSYVPAAATLSTPSTAGNGTINYNGPLTGGTLALPHGINGTLTYNYFGQEFIINNLTASWDATSRARFALTYRFSNRNIGQGVPHTGDLQETDPVSGALGITENGGIFNTVLRPAKNWELNGSAEVAYADNVFTPVSPRQSQQYRVHTIYRPKSWMTVSGAFNDRERRNNTNNNQEAVAEAAAAATPTSPTSLPFEGPLNHVDHSRVVSVGTEIMPNEHYGFDLSYSYSDVYTSTNICYTSGAASNLPGAATLTSNGAANVCPGIFSRGSTTILVDWFAKDFMDAPTQFGTAAFNFSPVDKFHGAIGYRISDVNGSRFFNDARDVNGSLVSKYQTPYLDAAYTVHPGLILKLEYNYFGYTEGGPSGAKYCSFATSSTASVVPCNTITAYPTGVTEPTSGLTAARNFRADNVVLGVHYEF